MGGRPVADGCHADRRPTTRAAAAATAAATAAAQQQQPEPTPPTVRYWTTEWSFPNIDVNSLLSRLQSIGIAVPIEADGIVSVDFTVSVPLTRLRDGKAYRLQGKVTSKRLRVQRMVLEDLQADVVYRDGVMTLRPARATWTDIQGGSIATRDGTFVGGIVLELLPLGNLHTTFQVDDIPIGSLHDLITGSDSDSGPGAAAGADPNPVPTPTLAPTPTLSLTPALVMEPQRRRESTVFSMGSSARLSRCERSAVSTLGTWMPVWRPATFGSGNRSRFRLSRARLRSATRCSKPSV